MIPALPQLGAPWRRLWRGLWAASAALLACAAGASTAREAGLLPAQVFSPRDYEGHNQMWSAVQDRRGVLYVGNRHQVLSYDGFGWRQIPIEQGLFVRGLALDERDRIWIGAVNELGYLDPDGRGGRTFTSLRDRLPEGHRTCGDLFQVFVLPHGVYFVGETRLFRWADNRFTVEEVGKAIGHVVGDELVIHVTGQPLRATRGAGWRVVADTPALRGDLVTFVAPQADGAWLLGLQRGGFWRWANGALTRFATDLDAMLTTLRIARARTLRDGSLAVLLRPGGLAFLDGKGRLLHYLDAANGGLPDSYAIGVFQDRAGDVWTSLNSGLVRFSWPPALSTFTGANGLGTGTIRVIARHAGRLHVGTTEGLFRLVAGSGGGAKPASARFERVPGFSDQVWGLASTGDHLLVAGTAAGAVVLHSDDTTVAIPVDARYTTAVLVPRGDADRAFYGTGSGVFVTRRQGGKWEAEARVPDIDGEVRQLVEARDGSIWVALTTGGLRRVLPPSEAAAGAPWRVEAYPGGHGLVSAQLPGLTIITNWRDDVAILDAQRIFRFEPAEKKFVEFVRGASHVGATAFTMPTLGTGVDGALWTRTLRTDPEAGPWQGRVFWRIDTAGRWHALPFAVADAVGENPVIFEEQSAAGLIAWLGGSEGLARIELPAAQLQLAPFRTQFARVMRADNTPLPLESPVVLPYARQGLGFAFATDRLDGRNLRFQTRLDDDPDGWSPLRAEPGLRFAGLPAGRHELAVRARNADGQLGEPATFAFTVLPPWWQTWWAFALYGLGGAGGVVGLARWRSRAIHRRNAELERLVATRTTDLRARERELLEARDAAEAANRAKSVFLASMSHDLRTPLNAVLGYAQLLRHAPGLNAESRRQIETVHASGDHLLQMINDVLDLAKIEAGKVELHVQPMSLPRLLAHLTEMFEPRAGAKHIAFALHGETPLPDQVLADEGRLRQVLYNLLGNAIKFTEHGRVELRVAAGDGKVRFTIIDTGIGIPAREQSAIFGLFHQAAGPALSAQGTGLGLAISQRLVRLMGGEITVQSPGNIAPSTSLRADASEGGPGSCFSFALELPPAPVAAPAPVVEMLPLNYSGARRRVLVVDDEPVNRDLLRALLEPRGFVIEETDSAEAALTSVAARPPDLVLMDLRLKRIDGLTATRQIRALPTAAAVRIVAISASVFPVDRTLAIEAGCDDFEPKPIRAKELLASIGRLLGLEWQWPTTASGSRPAALPDALPESWTLPPPAVLNELDAHADLGDIAALRATLEAARQAHPEAASFLDALESFAARAQLARLRDWITRAVQARPAGPGA